MGVTLASYSNLFGSSSVETTDSLAKNFTSASFLAVEKRPEDPETGADARKKPHSSGSEFAGVGLQLGATFGFSAWLGHYLDGRLGSTPWLTILFVFIGASAGFYSIYQRVVGRSGSR
jgi:ATP synthase protein I